MSTLDEQWLQDIAESMGLPALSPSIVKMILPVVEVHIKKIAQQAHKFQRRSKANSLTVEDVNAALAMNKIEPVYGLSRSESAQLLSTPPADAAAAQPQAKPAASSSNKKLVNLVEFGKNSALIPCPLKPEVSLHWLAVNGGQPLTADNPSVITADADDQPLLLPKELQNLYARIVGIVLSATSASSSSGLTAVLTVLRTDTGIQELAPYLSRTFYQQVRANGKRLVLLSSIISAIRALLSNPAVGLEFHLQQLMPAVFTCVVAAKLCGSPEEDHWSLRSAAAEVIAIIGAKYSAQFPELHARMCKTYLDALSPDKTLGTLYGAIVGLSALGNHIVRTLLVPNLHSIQHRLQGVEVKVEGGHDGAMPPPASVTEPAGKRKRGNSIDGPSAAPAATKATSSSGAAPSGKRGSGKAAAALLQEEREVSMCKQALLRALGKYMVHSERLPDLGKQAGMGAAGSRRVAREHPLPLCDLEEALVPYFVSASKQDYYCRLMI